MVFKINKGPNKGRLVVVVVRCKDSLDDVNVMLVDKENGPLIELNTGKPILEDLSTVSVKSLTLFGV